MDATTIPSLISEPTAIESPALTEQFLDFLRREKFASPGTARCYRADLHQFGQFLSGAIGLWNHQHRPSDSDLNQRFLGCTPLMGVEFRSYLFAQNYSKASIARKLAALKGFYKFLIRREKLTANPLSTIRPPKRDKVAPKYIDPEQIRKLLDAPGYANVLAVRDSAMLELLYSSGIRVSEMVELKLADINLETATVHVRGISPVNRVAPINPKALAAFQRYLPMRAAQGKTGRPLADAIFLNKDGGSLSTRSVRRKLEKYLLIAGLAADLSPSTIRHSFAIHLAAQGADAQRMKQILGYRNLNSAQNYTRLSAKAPIGNRNPTPVTAVPPRGATAA